VGFQKVNISLNGERHAQCRLVHLRFHLFARSILFVNDHVGSTSFVMAKMKSCTGSEWVMAAPAVVEIAMMHSRAAIAARRTCPAVMPLCGRRPL
jgi:hypothetical protein